MKQCPNCNLELPQEAHFCPRCMYEYPRIKRGYPIEKMRNRDRRTWFIILCAILIVGVQFWPLLKNMFSRDKEEQVYMQGSQEPDYIFRTNEMSVDNPDVVHDFEGVLFTDLHAVVPILGEEITEPYPDGEYMVYQFHGIEFDVSQDERIKSIYIDYLDVNEEKIEQYGIHGINGRTSREDVMRSLGNPDQEFSEEWCYRFDGERGIPTLRVIFDENGTVAALQYYTLQ